MEKQLTCEQGIDVHLKDELKTLSDLWSWYCEGHDDEYHPEHETNLYEYGLDFSFIEPNTFNDQPEGYYRYQLSWGGPSDEFRFYIRHDGTPYKIAYHFMDWFDGAQRNVTSETVLQELFAWFAEMGSCEAHKEFV